MRPPSAVRYPAPATVAPRTVGLDDRDGPTRAAPRPHRARQTLGRRALAFGATNTAPFCCWNPSPLSFCLRRTRRDRRWQPRVSLPAMSFAHALLFDRLLGAPLRGHQSESWCCRGFDSLRGLCRRSHHIAGSSQAQGQANRGRPIGFHAITAFRFGFQVLRCEFSAARFLR